MQTTTEVLFTEARSQNHYLDQPVLDATLRALYDLLKWGPTSANSCPARFLFVRSDQAKQRLMACMDKGNVEKVRQAPVTAVIGMDLAFYEHLAVLHPHSDARGWFEGNAEKIAETAFRNSTLQGAYLIMAARTLGLDCGPMSGFDNARVDAEFWAGTSVRSNFVCCLGHGDPARLHPRGPRLSFEQACQLL